MANARMQWVRRQSPVPGLLVVAALLAAVVLPHQWGKAGESVVAQAEQPGPALSRAAAARGPRQPQTVSAGLRLEVLRCQIDALRWRVRRAGGRAPHDGSASAAEREQAELQADVATLEGQFTSLKRALSAKGQQSIAFGSEDDGRLRALHMKVGELFGRLRRRAEHDLPKPEGRGRQETSPRAAVNGVCGRSGGNAEGGVPAALALRITRLSAVRVWICYGQRPPSRGWPCASV